MRSRRIGLGTSFVAICLAGGLCPDLQRSDFTSIARAIDDVAPVRDDDYPAANDWIEVDLAEKTKILELFVAEMPANYDKIETWTGSYTQHFEDGFGPLAVIHSTFDSICVFAVDVKANACFLAVEKGKQSYQNVVTHEAVKDHPSRILCERCLLTPEHYVWFMPDETMSGLAAIYDHKLPPKHVAYVDLPKQSQLSLLGDFVDPRLFFHPTGNIKAWGEYEAAYLPAFQGKHGEDVKARLDQMLSVSRATKNGELFYRARWQNRKGRRIKEYIHAASVGFNLIGVVSGPEDAPTHHYRWQYKEIDGIYVPSKVVLEYDNLQQIRTLTLRECILNQPLPPSQFAYSALGLGEEDLILNNIEKVAYLFKSGKPVRLSAYGDPPATVKPDGSQPAR
ncbi:MAG TPA: hypothetical protein VHY91_18405 [Pirellulales bacterium]|jgi:hypothetical protein|nr:hypothetical protein [Pirellulales bacterium]